ncbi:PREDICTED: cardiolipin synthase (CMP-forming)-like, partial [Cyprinodon variegatus]|uniref:cardiolipin synthase (CMP-forming)-like n=1 Tax=Cyprinodon variegatus TaxID=28743 RepID=UPI000742BD1A
SLQYENPWTVPNLLCVCRILLAPYLGYLITQQHFDLSLALFILAGATDLVMQTHHAFKMNLFYSIPLFFPCFSFFCFQVTLSKFFNPCYTTAQLKPTLFSKFNTAIQLCLVAASLAAPVFQYTDSILLQCLW